MYICRNQSAGPFWLGLDSISPKTEYTWYATNTTLATWTNWVNANPDDPGGTEQCLETQVWSGWKNGWNDRECTRSFDVVICQMRKFGTDP